MATQRDPLTDSDTPGRMTQLDRIERKIDHLDKTIRGDGDKIGHSGRLDRLEQESKRRSTFTITAMGAGVTALVGWLWTLLTKGTP